MNNLQYFDLFSVFYDFEVIGLSRVARGVDTLILPDRRSQGCLALRVPAPPPGTGGGVEKLRPPSKKTHYRKAFKNVTPPPPRNLIRLY